MQYLTWIGAVLAAIGLGTILWSAVMVGRARKEGLSDEALKAVIARMLPVNLGGLMTAVLGLMCVILGVSLG